ncbi:hypothetical protein NPIL_4771 [Nephila pilipes]|uniref:Uncharacterized protein n=1 Tax=Nephila pilipes TaxID=299642 RepID=A0A8X6U2U6_NEPPI|nr:hypothetical protein NPIL_4771 [Nephila pilipes]
MKNFDEVENLTAHGVIGPPITVPAPRNLKPPSTLCWSAVSFPRPPTILAFPPLADPPRISRRTLPLSLRASFFFVRIRSDSGRFRRSVGTLGTFGCTLSSEAPHYPPTKKRE